MATNKTVKVTVLPTLTGDTVASYNVYEGVSGTTLLGTMSVAEAAAGKVFAFTDGIVHSVKVQTVWTTAGASTLRSAGVTLDLSSTTIGLFSDDFAGTSINAAKWNDNQISGLSITQNNSLSLTPSGSSDGTTYESYLVGKSTVSLGATTVIAFDITHTDQNASFDFEIGLNGSSDAKVTTDRMVFANSNTAGKVTALVIKSGSSIKVAATTLDISSGDEVKMVLDSTSLIVYRWNSVSWVNVGSVATGYDISGLSWYPVIAAADKTGKTIPCVIDNFVITDTDFATLRPAS